jgi:hypothetical protein
MSASNDHSFPPTLSRHPATGVVVAGIRVEGNAWRPIDLTADVMPAQHALVMSNKIETIGSERCPNPQDRCGLRVLPEPLHPPAYFFRAYILKRSIFSTIIGAKVDCAIASLKTQKKPAQAPTTCSNWVPLGPSYG